MAAAFQIKGAENVIEAYNNRGVKAWSIFQGKQFLTKGIDSEELQTFLDLISEGTRAVYTLKVYDIDDPKLIKEKTEADGSFNFVLQPTYSEDRAGYIERNYGESNKANRLYERLGKIEEKLFAEPEEPEEKSIGSIITGLIENPGELMQLVQIGQMLGLLPQRAMPQPALVPARTIGNAGTEQPVSNEERLQRLANAIDTLEKNDPKLIEHLEKLAEISQVKASQFKFLIQALEMS